MKNDDIYILIRYRLEQAKTALEDAKYLLEGKRSSQSIINRAYYAMFYDALDLLQKVGKIPSKHAGVISLFDREFVLNNIFPRELSKDFHRAFELRHLSDYKTYEPISLEKSEEILIKAGKFVDAVEKYLNVK